MADINKVVMVGRLTRDAEQSYTQSGFALLKFSIAVNRRRKQGDQWVDEANFFDVTSFGRQGEAIAAYLTKGRQVAVEGQLRQDRWEAQDGTRRSKVYIEANYVQLLGGGRDGNTQGGNRFNNGGYENNPGNNWNHSAPQYNDQPRQPVAPQGAPATSFEDDIPF
ncbi:MAG: single-stranded DNA-binding protein [Spirochaetales bacterium]|nr:single-stranded DNA-binding protein [Spirochaetales bacterium]